MKPQPVVVTTICSECGLAWEAHGDKPTTSDCIRLLKAELAKRPTVTVRPWIQPYPYPVYPSYPYWYQYQGISGGTIQANTGYSQAINYSSNTVDYKTPAIEATCSAVS